MMKISRRLNTPQLCAVAAALSFLADRISKGSLAFFDCRAHFNGGISFGLFSGAGAAVTGFSTAAAAALVIAAFALLRRRESGKLLSCGLGLAIGGALGNLADRLLFGCVKDWIFVPFSHLVLKDGLWINIADISLCAGAAVVVLGLLRAAKRG